MAEYVEFTDKEKAENFDELAKLFYERNFGQRSKSDIELLMFNFYIKKLVADNQNEDGTVDYQKCSDYIISRDLGITQQRVRNLKVKNDLVNPVEFDRRKSFNTLTKNARYDKNTKMITINIPDPVLALELENFIESNGSYIEKTLNRKVIKLRVEYYIDLLISVEDEDNRKKIIAKLKKKFKDDNKTENEFDEKNIGQTLIELTKNVAGITDNIAEITGDIAEICGGKDVKGLCTSAFQMLYKLVRKS